MSASLPSAFSVAIPRSSMWAGRVVSGLAIAFLLMDGLIKLVPIPEVTQTLAQLGYPADIGFARGLGLLGLACTVLYAIPRTAVIGAVLLTGYLGGAIASHLRVGNPVFSHLLFGVYIGAMVWIGLWLRDARARRMLERA